MFLKKLKFLIKNQLSNDPLSRKVAAESDPSQLGEARIIEFMLRCINNQGYIIPKTFLELGANSPYNLSITWYLEKTLGFSGVSIDPISDVSDLFLKHRPKTHFINKAFVSKSHSSSTITYFNFDCNVLSTTDELEANSAAQMGYKYNTKTVNTTTAGSLPQYFNERIGVLVIDIESHSLQIQILKEISQSVLKPYIICVESIDFLPSSSNLREDYDFLLKDSYVFSAGTYLNSIYICKTITKSKL